MTLARWQPRMVLVALTLASVGWAVRRTPQTAFALLPWYGVALVPAGAHLMGIELADSGWVWGGVSCVALFLLNLAMIRIGVATERESWINFGIAGIALNIVTRYFLLFGTMLEGGVFFIVTGLLVLGLGYWLERKRRALVSVVRKEAIS